MALLGWSQSPAVESTPDKRSGAPEAGWDRLTNGELLDAVEVGLSPFLIRQLCGTTNSAIL